MGKTIFAAVIAAVLASIATVLVMNSFQAEQRAADAAERTKADETAKVERERLERRVADVEKRAAAAPRPSRRAEDAPDPSSADKPAAHAATVGVPAPLAPDGTPYVSLAEMQAEIKKAQLLGITNGVAVEAVKPVPKKTLDEIAREMNLTAGEEASLRNVLRSTEEDLIRCLYGDRPIDDVKRDVHAAKDDPDKKAELIQQMAVNAIPNFGRLVTMQERVKKQVESILGAEKAAKFLAQPRKPVIDPEFEDFLK